MGCRATILLPNRFTMLAKIESKSVRVTAGGEVRVRLWLGSVWRLTPRVSAFRFGLHVEAARWS